MTPDDAAAAVPPDFTVAIIGAGVTGIGAAIALGDLGYRYEIFEASGDIGGTWRVNTYPGVAVDTPASTTPSPSSWKATGHGTTRLGDIGAALRQLEPLCAAMCAARPDRAQAVVPGLRAAVREQAEAIGDGPRTREIINRFHRGLITGCGNQSLVLVVGALEVVWAGHASALYDRAEFDEPDIAKWQTSVRHHERIVDSIEKGDAGVTTMVARHLEATQAYMSSIDDSRRVTAAATAAVIG